MFRTLRVGLVVGLFALPGMSMADIVSNGGFEGGFSGWTASNASIDPNAPDAHSGVQSVVWQNSAPGSVSQSLTTVAGQTYLLDFWASPGAGYAGDGSFFKVEFGNDTLLNLTDLDDPTNWSVNYQHFMYYVVGTGTDDLRFSFYSAESEGWLDDVSVAPVPLPAAAWLFGSGLIGFGALRKKART